MTVAETDHPSKYVGLPCRHGHGNLRYKAGGACVTCSNDRSKARWRTGDEAWKKQRRQKYATPEGRADRRERNLMRNYGLTLDQFETIAAAQNYKCDICKIGEAKVVDHCHRSGRNRAILCVGCNVGLGSFRDDPEVLTRAIAYLRKHGD